LLKEIIENRQHDSKDRAKKTLITKEKKELKINSSGSLPYGGKDSVKPRGVGKQEEKEM